MENLNVGLIGYKFMGKAHSFAYKNAGLFFDLPFNISMKAICGRNKEHLKEAQRRFGWEECTTDWKSLIERPDIDIIDIATPPDIHKDIAIHAAKAGKIVFCEKPLSISLRDGYEMLEIAEKYNIKHALCFNYRKLPATALAKQLIEDGKIGSIYHTRAVYLQDWLMDPDFPLVWRLDKNVAGSGAHGDLNAHLIDMARYLVGEFDEVSGISETFIKERPMLDVSAQFNSGLSNMKKSKDTGRVTVDDATLFLARFKNGALGSFEATRFAAGRKNGQRFEINGSKGSIVFNLENLNELEYYSLEGPSSTQGFTKIIATEGSHPYAANWWPAGHIIGYGESFVNTVADLCFAIAEDSKPSPNFYDGVRCQEVLFSVGESIKTRKWVKVKE